MLCFSFRCFGLPLHMHFFRCEEILSFLKVRALDLCFMEHIRYKKSLWGMQRSKEGAVQCASQVVTGMVAKVNKTSTTNQRKVQPGVPLHILRKFEASLVILFPTPAKLAPVWPQCNPQCGYQDYLWLEQNSLSTRDTAASMLITHFHRHHRAQTMIVNHIAQKTRLWLLLALSLQLS